MSAVDGDKIGSAFKRPTSDLDILISFEMNCCTDCVPIVNVMQSPHEKLWEVARVHLVFIADWLLRQYRRH